MMVTIFAIFVQNYQRYAKILAKSTDSANGRLETLPFAVYNNNYYNGQHSPYNYVYFSATHPTKHFSSFLSPA